MKSDDHHLIKVNSSLKSLKATRQTFGLLLPGTHCWPKVEWTRCVTRSELLGNQDPLPSNVSEQKKGSQCLP